MNWGWYTVYLIMVVINSTMCVANGFGFNTWQYWVWLVIPMMSWIAGRSCQHKED